MYTMRKNVNETPFFKIHIVLAMQKEKKKQLPNANDLKEKYLNPTTNLQFFLFLFKRESFLFLCGVLIIFFLSFMTNLSQTKPQRR